MKKLTALFLSLVLLLSLSGCQSTDYKKALSLKNGGDAEAAATLFETLGDYKDSASQLTACRYTLAVKTFNSGDMSAAAEQFLALGDYADSADYCARANDALLKDQLVGSWEGELDISGIIAEYLGGDISFNKEMSKYLELDDILCTIKLEITAKGTAQYSYESESYRRAVNRLIDATAEAVYCYYEANIESMLDEETTIEELFEFYKVEDIRSLVDAVAGNGGTMGDMIKDLIPVDVIVSSVAKSVTTGIYSVKNGEITFTFNKEEQSATLINGELTLLDPGQPVTFTRK